MFIRKMSLSICLCVSILVSGCDLALPGTSKTETQTTTSPSIPTTTIQISDPLITTSTSSSSSSEETAPSTSPIETSDNSVVTTSEGTTTLQTSSTRRTFPTTTTSRTSRETSNRVTEPTTSSRTTLKGSIAEPYSIGEIAKFDGYDTIFDPFKADVMIQNIYRGYAAQKMVKDASPINPAPQPDHEYLIAQVLVKVTESKNDEIVGVSPYFFSLAREDGRMYGDVNLFRAVTPVLEPLRVGETSIAYICFQVAKSDENPYIVFLSRAHDGIWFETNEADTSDFSNETLPTTLSEDQSESRPND